MIVKKKGFAIRVLHSVCNNILSRLCNTNIVYACWILYMRALYMVYIVLL